MSVALVIQHAKRMRRIILSSVTCLAVPYFSTLCITPRRKHEINLIFQLKMGTTFQLVPRSKHTPAQLYKPVS
jgi:hypothetical protein